MKCRGQRPARPTRGFNKRSAARRCGPPCQCPIELGWLERGLDRRIRRELTDGADPLACSLTVVGRYRSQSLAHARNT
jgi:hypothetical protein